MKNYLSVKDVSEKLGCSIAFVYRLAEMRKIPFIQLDKNSRIFFDPDELESFLQLKKIQPAVTK